MKITKKQLTRIIKEEKQKLLKEYGGMPAEIMSPLVQFADAYSGLGSAVSAQVIDVVNAYIENRKDAVYEINPNALEMALQRLRRPLMSLGQSNPDAEEVLEALEWAENIMEEEGIL